MSKPLPSVLECARLYLAPGPDSFWRWSDDQEAIEWRDGGTLLLREELLSLFDARLQSGRGMPPLDHVALLAAILRDQPRAGSVIQAMLERLGFDGEPIPLPNLDAVWLRLHHRPAARVMLYDWLLTKKAASVQFSERVRDAMRQALPAQLFEATERRRDSLVPLIQDLHFTCRGLCAGRIELLAQVGLEELPQAEATDLPATGDARRLLESLTEDGELQDFARVVRDVGAAFRLPRRLEVPQQTSQGGTAGIGNRGPLDRLLLAELAHDDEVLAVRVATNEALYAEPELPPVQHRPRRHVLLDCGVSTWGTARVLGVAVAMALASDAPRTDRAEVAVQTCVQGRLVAVDLATREGLIEQLQRLDEALDVTSVLDAWCTATDGEQRESVIVLARSTLASPQVRERLLTGATRRFVVDIAVTAQGGGAARLWQARPRGLQLLREAQLRNPTLDQQPRTPGFPLPLPQGLTNLPQCLRADTGAALHELSAVLLGHGTIAVRTRRGSQLTVRTSQRGTAALVAHHGKWRAWPLLSLPPMPDLPRLQMVTVANAVHVYWDGHVLHFVPRVARLQEFAVLLRANGECVGWCYREQRELRGDDLLARLRQLSEDLS